MTSSSCGKAASVNSVNSSRSESGATYKAYDAGSDGRTSAGGGGHTEAVHEEPAHHAADRLDAYSLKSYSTASQVSTVADKYVLHHTCAVDSRGCCISHWPK